MLVSFIVGCYTDCISSVSNCRGFNHRNKALRRYMILEVHGGSIDVRLPTV